MGNGKLIIRARDFAILTLLLLALALPGLANLPVIDRDEARYAQASVQMIETGDYVNIRFQDRARNKKPAGVYWLQSASVKLLSDVKKREIWAHRVPSVLGALLAIFATYWGGIRLIGRDGAITGAMLLAISLLFVFEAHIAKTDALLCGFSALALASLGHLRNGGERKTAILLWLALGCAVMIKGPILPLLIGLCLLSLFAWERQAGWMKPLLFWPGPLLFLMIVLPWMFLIWQTTDGAFFSEAIGGDLTPKLQGGHEKHGGPPGYHSVATWIMFWPSCLFLLPGLIFAFRAAGNKHGSQTPISKSARLLICWAVPYFIFVEIIPTKLPHYTLPIYPALALMAALAVLTLSKIDEFGIARKINAILFALVSIILLVGLLFGESFYGSYPTWSFGVMGVALLISLYAALRLWNGQGKSAFLAIIALAFLVNIPTYQFTLPSLDTLLVSRNVKNALVQEGISFPLDGSFEVYSPQFTEPSLVHGLGTDIILGEPEKRLTNPDFDLDDMIILDRKNNATVDFENQLLEVLKYRNQCLVGFSQIEGFNYSKGDEVLLDLMRVVSCPEPDLETAEDLSAPDGT
ncbi:MAG: glycosyltransferase family 39 protein [Hyphomonadaceae bacterium]|nr:glycosyltransferase family 39 protein [Hyphomonadaceae bacterium]